MAAREAVLTYLGVENPEIKETRMQEAYCRACKAAKRDDCDKCKPELRVIEQGSQGKNKLSASGG